MDPVVLILLIPCKRVAPKYTDPGQYESVASMLSCKMDFNCCANRDGFCKSSYICDLA